jgi:hypothetical protein
LPQSVFFFCFETFVNEPKTLAAEMFAAEETDPPQVGGPEGSGVAVVQRLTSLHLQVQSTITCSTVQKILA